MAGVWDDLEALTRDVVEQMNNIAEIKQRTGGLYFQRGQLHTIVVKKQTLPAIYLTLTRGTDVIDVHYRILINGPNGFRVREFLEDRPYPWGKIPPLLETAMFVATQATLPRASSRFCGCVRLQQYCRSHVVPAESASCADQSHGCNERRRCSVELARRVNQRDSVYIERCQGTGCASFIGVGASDANITTWRDYNAAAGQSYTYRVRAWNSDGYSGYSNDAAIVTPGGIPAQPPAPSNLASLALNKSQIRLTWTNNSTSQDGVKIERCKGSNCTNFTQITTVGGTASTYTDSDLTAGTTYRYRVRVYNSFVDSQYSNIATAKTLRK